MIERKETNAPASSPPTSPGRKLLDTAGAGSTVAGRDVEQAPGQCTGPPICACGTQADRSSPVAWWK
jgi:hypothetical protein